MVIWGGGHCDAGTRNKEAGHDMRPNTSRISSCLWFSHLW